MARYAYISRHGCRKGIRVENAERVCSFGCCWLQGEKPRESGINERRDNLSCVIANDVNVTLVTSNPNAKQLELVQLRLRSCILPFLCFSFSNFSFQYGPQYLSSHLPHFLMLRQLRQHHLGAARAAVARIAEAVRLQVKLLVPPVHSTRL